jgi:hypothetical protein
MNKYFDKNWKIGPLSIYVEGALTHHVIGLGSVEWGAGKSRSYSGPEGELYATPAYLNIDTNLPFSWIRVNIEKKNK